MAVSYERVAKSTSDSIPVLRPVTNTLDPSGLTPMETASSVVLAGPSYRASHRRVPVAVWYAAVA